jgi:glucose-1-phosphate adenylyltransferase
VLILAGDHIYKMDYGPMIAQHVERNAKITVGCIEVPIAQGREFGVMSVDEDLRIHEFTEKPEHPDHIPGNPDLTLASMGIYVFDADFLATELQRDAKDFESSHDFGKDIVPRNVPGGDVWAYPFRDVKTRAQHYWRDVGNVDAFFEANLELVGVKPELNLYDQNWPIWTEQRQLPPAKFVLNDGERRGMAVNSMVSGGCIISGAQVDQSLLFWDVHVESHSRVHRSVILPGVRIGRSCRISNTVIDEGCHIADGTEIGQDPEADRERYFVTDSGVVLVTRDMLGETPSV